MTNAFDPRIIQLGIQFPNGTTTFQDLNIRAAGRKYTTAIMNECEVAVYNLTTQQKHDILTQASPQNQSNPVKMTLDIGRQSYGTFRLFEGNVIACAATQPPDVGLILRSLTNNYFMSQVAGYTAPPVTLLSQIAQQVATSNNLTLVFQATDKQINNYAFTGAAAKQVQKLAEMGSVNAYVDNEKLVVLDLNKPLNTAIRLVNSKTGMVGVPEVTTYGVRVKMMIDNSIQLFGQIQVESEINPAANGIYYITQLNFEVANREEPFWYILECRNPNYFLGGAQ